LLIGEVASRSGVSRKAVRLYERDGILPPPARTAGGYRFYGEETVRLLAFVVRARRLGLRLAEIREIVAVKRAGGTPCPHVRRLVRTRRADVEQRLRDLTVLRRELDWILRGWRGRPGIRAVVCAHIEAPPRARTRRTT
jgi:DNA-binding transcriptional MerR regulator